MFERIPGWIVRLVGGDPAASLPENACSEVVVAAGPLANVVVATGHKTHILHLPNDAKKSTPSLWPWPVLTVVSCKSNQQPYGSIVANERPQIIGYQSSYLDTRSESPFWSLTFRNIVHEVVVQSLCFFVSQDFVSTGTERLFAQFMVLKLRNSSSVVPKCNWDQGKESMDEIRMLLQPAWDQYYRHLGMPDTITRIEKIFRLA